MPEKGVPATGRRRLKLLAIFLPGDAAARPSPADYLATTSPLLGDYLAMALRSASLIRSCQPGPAS
jgi:hypothetical protein